MIERRKPILLVEAKWADTEIDRSLRYLHARYPSAEVWQIIATGTKDYRSGEGIRVAPAHTYLTNLV